MSMLHPRDEVITRHLRRRSWFALGLLATLAFTSLLIFRLQTETIKSGAQIVNTSGRQRMLSQRTALLAEAVYSGTEDAASVCRKLRPLTDEMERAHHGLLHGDDELKLPPDPPESVRAIYLDAPHFLDLQVGNYLKALREVCTSASPDAREHILATSRNGQLLQSLDTVVSAFQEREEERVAQLQQAEVAIFVLILMALCLTGLRVIAPMIAQVEGYLGELRTRQTGLIHRTEMRLSDEEALRDLQTKIAEVGQRSTVSRLGAELAEKALRPLEEIEHCAQSGRTLLMQGSVHPKEHLELLIRINEQSDIVDQTIRSALVLGDDAPDRRELCEINHFVREAVRLTEIHAVFNEVSMKNDLAEDLPRVFVDPIQIQYAVYELLLNAIEATSPKTVLPIEIHTRVMLDEIFIKVIDPGSGLTPEAQVRLFEPFYTTKESSLGVGLSNSLSIATAHGGRLFYRERAEGGLVFSLALPVARKSA